MSGATPRDRDGAVLVGLLLYTGLVHVVDTLAAMGASTPVDWGMFRWHLSNGFDLFKFFAWLLLPLAFMLALRRVDWSYFSFRGWRRVDVALLALLVGAGFMAVATIRFLPSLQEWYPGMGSRPAAEKIEFGVRNVLWTVSWLVGWEFLHRYALMTTLTRVWPRYGWLAVPVIEGLYHLQKHPLEMAGMVAFSLVLTYWARSRRNVLLPFLAHLAVELELIAFLLVSG